MILLSYMEITAPHQVCACSGSGAAEEMMIVAYMGRGYGHVSTILAMGIAYLKIRCSGWRKFGLHFGLIFPFFYFYNSGWHFRGWGGDCGYYELSQAWTSMLFLGLLLIWQIAVAFYVLYRLKNVPNPVPTDSAFSD
ncbi:MAG TPA: hypothetical protein VGB77_10290 [Abditibacteriaceae bacterium]